MNKKSILRSKLKQTKLLLLFRWLSRFYQGIKDKKGKSIIQLANTTYFNRHPDLFIFVKSYFKEVKEVNILSFGCSTGLECTSISTYFPLAKIKGYDINKKNIKIAKETNKTKNIEYFHVDVLNDDLIIKDHKFNAIFALSVLCIEPEAKQLDDINSLFSFKEFEKVILKLDKMLCTDGLLIIRNANYRFEDTILKNNYEPILGGDTAFPLFSIEGKKIPGPQKIYWIFKKI